MINYNFDTKVVSDAMYEFFRAYYTYKFIDYIKPIYTIIYELTLNKWKSALSSFLFSLASFIFAKTKHHKVHHRRLFIVLAAMCAKLLLGTSTRRSHHIGVLMYGWYWQDRVDHGYMTPLRDQSLMHVEAAIFGGDPELYRAHSVSFNQALIMLDPYEYHEVELADWGKVREKLEESFWELKGVLKGIDS